ncbi:signal peptide peptidase SppA [Buchnera aphidicola]|uniref:signal peptide peptidase SppA n=1 Tax=Buchnera aphidicola TaxID=9 RepID=UPI0031B6C5B3
MKYFLSLISNLINIIYSMVNFIKKFSFNIFLILLFLLISIIFIEKNFNINYFSYKKVPLLININGLITEKKKINQKTIYFISKFINLNFQKNKENSIFEIVDKIRQAKNDNKINGIILDLQNFSGSSQNLLEYIGKSLKEFSFSKKPIYSIANNYSQSQYYISSFSDKIFLCSQGKINIDKYKINQFYYKNFLKYLKVQFNIVKIKKNKSIIRFYPKKRVTTQSTILQKKWINFLWKRFIKKIKKNRNIRYKKISYSKKKLIKGFKKNSEKFSEYERNKKLVDFIYPYPKIRKILIKKFGFNKKKNNFNYININDYHIKNKKSLNKIAVIILDGFISENKNYIINKIKIAKKRKDIKALIFRINTPGGNIIFSERIREELINFKDSKKPVIISMGQIVASEGYRIASVGDYIFAHPTTLISPIKIFNVKNTFNKLIYKLKIDRNKFYSSFFIKNNLFKKFKKNKKKIIQLKIKYDYLNNLKKIAKSRKLSLKKIKKLEKKEIYIGIEGKNNKLVDFIGDFDDALKKTIFLSNISNYQIIWMKKNNYFLN